MKVSESTKDQSMTVSNDPLQAFADGERVGRSQVKKTLRDQLAMAALTGLMAGQFDALDGITGYAKRAYVLADAMMEARDE